VQFAAMKDALEAAINKPISRGLSRKPNRGKSNVANSIIHIK